MTSVARSIFVGRTAGATPDPVDILIAFGGVLRKIDPSSEHAFT